MEILPQSGFLISAKADVHPIRYETPDLIELLLDSRWSHLDFPAQNTDRLLLSGQQRRAVWVGHPWPSFGLTVRELAGETLLQINDLPGLYW